jgi:AI-2 transport protein TqsA
LFGLASIFVIAAGIRGTADILNPILLAAVITIVVMPLPGRLTDRGLPSWLSFVLTLVVVVGGLLLIMLLMVMPLLDHNGNLPDELNPITQPGSSVDNAPQNDLVMDTPQDEGGADAAQPALSSDTIKQLLNSLSQGNKSSQLRESIISTMVHGVSQLFMVMIIFIFMLSAAISLPSASSLDFRNNNAITRIEDLTQDVRRYMSITTAVNFLVGVGDAIFLMIMGVEYAILWGLLAWVMGYIPTVGFWFALIPPVILAYTQQGLQTAMIVLVGYVLINGSVQNFIQPRMMGQGLGISPVVIFISLFIWGWLLGGIGAILAVPLTLLIIAVLKSFSNTRWMATLMSVPPSKDKGDDKKRDHEDAKDKLKDYWEHTKRTLKGNVDGDVPVDVGDKVVTS